MNIGNKKKSLFAGAVRILLPCLLIASISLNVLTWRELHHVYREMKTVRLDPLGLHDAKFPPDAPTAASQNLPVVLFIGDSRAQAWPAPKVPGWRFSNRGIDGQSTEQVLGRFADQVSAVKPQVIVIQVGVNDLTAIGVIPERQREIVESCKANIHKMIAIGRSQGATLIVTTIFPAGPVTLGRRAFWSEQIPASINLVNEDLRKIDEPGVIVFDADKILLDGGKVRNAYYLDTLHLRSKGYESLNGSLQQVLASQQSK